MAGDLTLVYRWIPSEYNVADRDSRRWEENHILCETADTPCSSDLKPMIGELDAPLSPLVEDASPWIEFCSQQITKTWRQKPKKRRDQGIPTRKTLTNGEIRMVRGTMARRGSISLHTPRICRTIQASRVVERVSGLSLLESNAVAPGTMDSCRRAVTDFEPYASEIGQHLDWKSGVEIEGGCLEYLDLLFTQGFGPEVGNRLMAAIRTIFPLLQPSWRSRHAKDSESSEKGGRG